MLFSLYFCSLCIVVRNIYRLIEYQAGESGYLQTHEWLSYVLDVALMALMMMISLIWYFSNTKPKDPASYRLDGCDGQA